jgi:hypothetical protein
MDPQPLPAVPDPQVPIPPPQPAPYPKPKHLVSSLGVLLIVVGLASLSFWVFKNFSASPIPKVEQVTPTPIPLDTPDPTANWKVVTSKFWSLKVPQNWSSHKCTDVDESLSVGPEIPKDIVVSKVQCEGGGFSTLTITRNSGGFSIPVSIAQNKSDPSAYFLTVKDKKTIQIGGQNAIIQTEEAYSFGPNNPVESVAVYIQKAGYTDSIIVADRSFDDPKTPPFLETKKIFDQILSTFQFTDQTNPTPTCRPRPACLDATPRCMIPETSDMCPYSCPTNGYVDCMPIMDAVKQRACSAEAFVWYQTNCPNFKGGAL